MSDLVVIAFDREGDARYALAEMRVLEGLGVLKLTDSAVVAKDADGTVHIKNEVIAGTETGAVVGAAAGAHIGNQIAGNAVDGRFVKDVGKALTPSTSALFLIIRSSDANALRAAIEPYEGRVYQTALSPELEATLNQALR